MSEMTVETATNFVDALIRMRKGDAYFSFTETRHNSYIEFIDPNYTQAKIEFHPDGTVHVISRSKTIILEEYEPALRFYHWLLEN